MKILSYNIQAAINSSGYLSYLWQWPRQILPTAAKRTNLRRIASFLRDYEVVCLQEIELGGLRNGFANQLLQLQELSDFPEAVWQLNRRVGRLSAHGNVILARQPLQKRVDVPLPGKIRGRGLLAAQLGDRVIATTHLSLGRADQLRQLAFIRATLQPWPAVLLCGDFNCGPQRLAPLTDGGWQLLGTGQASFPSWKPRRCLDHALLRGGTATAEVLTFRASDHLPLAIGWE